MRFEKTYLKRLFTLKIYTRRFYFIGFITQTFKISMDFIEFITPTFRISNDTLTSRNPLYIASRRATTL